MSAPTRPRRVETAGADAAAPTQGSRIWLYSGDGDDTPIRHDDLPLPDLGDKQMLWVDVDLECVDELETLWHDLGIEDLVSTLPEAPEQPALLQHNGMIQLNVIAIGEGPNYEPTPLHCLVAENWVVTLHHGRLDLVDEFNKPFHGETLLGELDGPSFLSLVLDWQVSGYFRLIQALQGDIDRLDEELLQRTPDQVALLHRLQKLRMRVRQLRHTLGPHREVLSLLGHPESDAALGSITAPDYQRLEDRLERAIDSVDTAREMIVGSFDIFMTRTAQATNEIVKRLTVVSVLLLPAGVIAGIMGMNFKVGFFNRPGMFWVVLATMGAIAGATLLVARHRDWF